VIEQAVELAGADITVRLVGDAAEARFEPGRLDVVCPLELDRNAVTPGVLSMECGRAVTAWWQGTMRLAREGRAAAVVKAPVNSEAIRLGGGDISAGTRDGATYLFLLTGPLRVVHLTDHIPLREVFGRLTCGHLLELLRLTHASLRAWGVKNPRIGVAGINPHAYGDEERKEIAPAIAAARAEGICAEGPVPPDSLFRLCTEGAYDCVVAHYHDQGHIAVKTWRFEGNCAILLGEPYLGVSVAHGTAFDIAGRGIADHRSMAKAMQTAAMLAAGRGFPPD